MQFTNIDIDGMDTRFRANFFNSITGFKSVNLVGTQDAAGSSNLSIFSSVFHMGSKPPLFGILFRPAGEVLRHTLENILATGFYTLNHITPDMVSRAHQSSAKYPKGVSEFEVCDLDIEKMAGFIAPFVKESKVKMGMKFLEALDIKHNNTVLVIGRVEVAVFPNEVLREDGFIDLEQANTITCSGLDSYHTTNRIARFSYARPDVDLTPIGSEN